MAIISLDEVIDSVSPSQEGVSIEDGASTRLWQTPLNSAVNSPQDLIDTENYFVGGTSSAILTGARAGSLNRTLPAVDPMHANPPAWWCRKVNSVQGFMDRVLVQPDGFRQFDVGGGPFAFYPLYRYNVTYGPRPYPVAPDAQIHVYTSNPVNGNPLLFYWPDGVTSSNYTFAEEWKRFCTTPKFNPQNDYVTAQQGSFYFRTGGGNPNGYAFTGQPRIFLRTDIVTLEWYGVPLRYITSVNSYIRRFRGLVNQYPWYEAQADGTKKLFGAGSLLYLAYSYTDYCSPTSALEQTFGGGGGLFQILAPQRLINVTLTFLHTDRRATNPPAAWAGAIANPDAAGNWGGYIMHGNNCLPWLGDPTNFYYATGIGGALDLPSKRAPMFASFPVELLFTDPDAAQPAGFPPPGQGGI